MMTVQKSVRTLVMGMAVGAAAAMPLASHAATINGELTASSPLFDRTVADDPPPCGPGSSQNYPYDSYPITHSGGTLTIDMKGSDSGSGTLFDPYLVLYDGPFDPNSPCDNYLEHDDDGGTGLDARISADHPAGDYVIVATSWNRGHGTYVLETDASIRGIAAVPTLSEWMLLLMGALVAGVGVLRFRRGKPV